MPPIAELASAEGEASLRPTAPESWDERDQNNRASRLDKAIHADSQAFVSRSCHATPLGHDDGMTDADDLTADDLEQLAQSLAVDGSLGRADTLRIVEVLRALAAARRATPHRQIRR